MIALWHQGKYFDSWFNTLNDLHFMEVSMINLGFDPTECEWLEYEGNPNGHNPKKIEDSDKSVEWIVDELVPTAIVTNPEDIPAMTKKYYSKNIYLGLARIIAKQHAVLDKYSLDKVESPEIPPKMIAETVVENKIVMNPMKKMTPTESDYVFKAGARLKRYSAEDPKTVLPKFKNLKSLALYLLAQKVNWQGPFKAKLESFKGLDK